MNNELSKNKDFKLYEEKYNKEEIEILATKII